MESSRTTFVPEVELLQDRRPPGELSLVEIAERLEKVTHAIEAERTAEREARRVYQEVATRVEASIASIRAHARSLVDEQRRRMASFDGMIGDRHVNGHGRTNGNGNGATIHEAKPRDIDDDGDETMAVAHPGAGGAGGAGRGGRLNIMKPSCASGPSISTASPDDQRDLPSDQGRRVRDAGGAALDEVHPQPGPREALS